MESYGLEDFKMPLLPGILIVVNQSSCTCAGSHKNATDALSSNEVFIYFDFH